jgi:hypothetical protein
VEKERLDYGTKDSIQFIVGFKTFDDVLEEWLDFCRGELVGGRYGCGEEWT